VQQSYACSKCGYPVVFADRFCGNCGTFLNWPTQQSNHGQLRLQQKKTGAGLFTFTGLMVIGMLIVVLIAGGIIAYDSYLQAPVSSAIPMSQPLPQPLPLATPIILSPGLYTDPGQAIDTITPSFQWNAVSGADYYSLIISKFPYGFGDIVCTPSQLAGTSLIIPGGVLEYGQRYRWAIEAHNNTSPSSISNALYFQTPQPPPSLPLSDSTAAKVPAAHQPDSTPISPPVSAPPWTPEILPGSPI